MKLLEDYSLKTLNTFGIEAKAKYYSGFSSIPDLMQLLEQDVIHQNPLFILGGGSNILLTKDFEGVVLQNKIKGIAIANETEEHAFVTAGAGEVWHDLVLFSIGKNLGGIENLSLIPGTVGASPIQNIGAYGVELKDVFYSLNALEISSGKIISFGKDECNFGYRDSIFKREAKGKYIIIAVTLKLNKNPQFNVSYGAIKTTLEEMGITEISVKAISDAVIHIRRSKLPDPAVIGNAGSFFKNPEIPESQFNELKVLYPSIPSFRTIPGYIKVPAGWLNEQCGWKGKRFGNAGVHKDQALVLVNYGGANGSEIKALATEVQKSVKEKFGIELEMEVNMIPGNE